MHPLYSNITPNHEITVYDTNELYGEKGSFRVLEFSSEAVQGAMDLDHPERIVFEYPRAMIHLMEANNPSFENVFVIGHGIGTIAGHYRGKRKFKTAELDGEIVELSRRFFGYDQDNVVIGDGRRILEGEESQAYDYVILDAFSEKGTPLHLTSREFFRIVEDKLDPQGAILMNLTGKGANDKLINAIHTTLREVFAFTRSFSLPAGTAADKHNILLIGSRHPIVFRARQMAGFTETALGEGYVITEESSIQQHEAAE